MYHVCFALILWATEQSDSLDAKLKYNIETIHESFYKKTGKLEGMSPYKKVTMLEKFSSVLVADDEVQTISKTNKQKRTLLHLTELFLVNELIQQLFFTIK